MEVPLTPLEFARRARKLYPLREAVVDGERRFTYAEFFERCDRWSAALQKLGTAAGDRVATVSHTAVATVAAIVSGLAPGIDADIEMVG